MTLIFDTETTGKADFKKPANDPCQPHLVQLAAQLLDDDLEVMAEISFIVYPDTWSIPNQAAEIHGITTEMATKAGLPLIDVLQIFLRLLVRSRTIVAHNLKFDTLILTNAFDKTPLMPNWTENLNRVDIFCTMLEMVSHCNLPGPYGPKWPKLQEAYSHCGGSTISNFHNAMADVQACAHIYRWLKRNINNES